MKTTQKACFPDSTEKKSDRAGHTSVMGGPTGSAASFTLPAKNILSCRVLLSLLGLILILYLVAGDSPSRAFTFTRHASGTILKQHADLKNNGAPAAMVNAIQVDSTEELLGNLRSRNLWDIDDNAVIPQVLFANLPQDMNSLDVETKKRAFINTLLPISLIALNEISQEKKSLEAVLEKLNRHEDTLFFGDDAIWPDNVSEQEKNFLQQLTLKYRTNSKAKLQSRIDVLPVSLILAQGALESSWGSSRFVMEGNNLFGIWSWSNEGITPENRDKGASHKVASYDSLLDSVRAYLLMINRLPAYSSLRELRNRSASSMDLAEGLLLYSARRDSYIEDVKQIIAGNELQRFDSMALAENSRPQPRQSLMNYVQLVLPNNANI